MHRVVPLSLLALGLLNHPQAQAERAFFRSPPTRVSLHNPASIEGERNRTTISITVPHNAGADLEQVVLRQLISPTRWDWGRRAPAVYRGPYAFRTRPEQGEATALLSNSGADVQIRLIPPAVPGETVNIVFRSINPEEGIYQWSTGLIPQGESPITSAGPTLRLHIQSSTPFH